ncbi:MAG: hypothetical protein WD267_13535 [Balneolales bacterium]
MVQKKETPSDKFTEFDEAADYGVMYDKLNVKNITFWTLMGLGVLIVVIVGVIALYNFNKFQFQEAASMQSEFRDYAQVRADRQVHLDSAGIIDEEAGVYHIPIDSAMDLIINESEQ